MLRLALKSRIPSLATRSVVSRRVAAPAATFQRKYSTSDEEKWNQMAENPVVRKLAQHPEVMAQIAKANAMMLEKGYVTPGKGLGIMGQFKILSDKDLKNQFMQVKESMDKAGIVLTAEDMDAMVKLMGSMQNGDKE